MEMTRMMKKENGEEITLCAEFYKNCYSKDSLRIMWGEKVLYEYYIRSGDRNATHYMQYDLLEEVYPEQHWDTREKYQDNWNKQRKLFDSIVAWNDAIAKDFLSNERKAFVSEIMEFEKQYPQKTKVPEGSILLGYSKLYGYLIRAYNYWDDQKRVLKQFITKDGGEPLYTRIVYAASSNFVDFWRVLNSGVLTPAGKKYVERHSDKYYSRERVF